MNKPSVGISDDYISLDAKNASFYYGYEVGSCKECGAVSNGDFCPNDENHEVEWCFRARFNGKEITIPSSKLGVKDQFAMTECLLVGIGWILARYSLDIHN